MILDFLLGALITLGINTFLGLFSASIFMSTLMETAETSKAIVFLEGLLNKAEIYLKKTWLFRNFPEIAAYIVSLIFMNLWAFWTPVCLYHFLTNG